MPWHTQAQATTAYDYEKNFVEQWAALGREVFQASLGPVPADRHQKKVITTFGPLTLPTHHVMNQAPAGFKVSPYVQTLALQGGQEFRFQKGSEWLADMAGINLSAKQIERITHHYGQVLETTPAPLPPASEDLHYCLMDGGMVLIGPNHYREMKVGRLVNSRHIQAVSAKRNRLTACQYVAHLGDCNAFFEKFAALADPLPQKVFWGDGASWIWDRVSARYPESVQILDFYHCWEKYCGFALLAFAEPG